MTRTLFRAAIIFIGLFSVTIIFWYLLRWSIDAANQTFNFDFGTDYTFDAGKISVSGGLASLIGNDQLDDDGDATYGFGAGSFSDTQYDSGNGWVELDGTGVTNGTGTFTSRIMDAVSDVSWDTISWVPSEPYLKELPGNGTAESLYDDRNVSMGTNALLLHLNETGAATTFDDDSGNGDDGFCGNCPTTGLDGVFNTALDFDGNNDELELPNTIADGIGDITVSTWFNTTKTGQQTFLSGANPGNNNEILWFLNSQTELRLYTGEAAGTYTSWTFPSIADGEWHHIVMVRDATNNEATVYLDGASEGTNSTTLNALTIPTGGLFIAQEQDSVGGGFTSSQAYDGLLDEYAIFHDVLDATEAENLYTRGIHRLTYQVRSCDDAACSGESFIGPDGTAGTYYSEELNSSAGLPSISLANVPDNRYFQYRVTLETDDTETPELQEVAIGPNHYPADDPFIQNNIGFSFALLEAFGDVLGAGNEGTVEYQISNDGATFYYHNGALWVAESGAGYPTQTNTATEVNDQLETFREQVGGGTFFFRAYLHSENGTQQVELDTVATSTGSPSGGQQELTITPQVRTFAIENGSICTSSRDVVLNSDVKDAVEMIISEDDAFLGADWQPYDSETAYQLSEGDGLKTVRVRYRSSTMNQTLENSDTIELDQAGNCGIVELPAEPVETPPEIQEPEIVLPPSTATGETCELDCSRLSYDVYIVNPDGTERHTDTNYVRKEFFGDEILLYFEDSGFDFDHNDLLVKLSPFDCSRVQVRPIVLDAGWHHQIRMKVYFDQFIREDLLLWEDSHKALNAVKVIDMRTSADICAIQRLRSEAPAKESAPEVVAESPEVAPEVVTSSCRASQRFTSFMSEGTVSGEVRALQELLQCLGYFSANQEATAIYGPLTSQAVSAFQAERGIEAVGYVGPSTRAKLNEYVD